MKRCIQILTWFLPSFATKHYECAICGAKGSSPEDLCQPVEVEFEQ